MIKNYRDYKKFREIEGGDRNLRFLFFPEPTSQFLKQLRKVEWHNNASGIYHKILYLISYYRYRKISLKTGISIPKNVCDLGLSLPHYGSIVVSPYAKIGKNCRIHNNVNIGSTNGNHAPKIGNNVYIGPGAVIYGNIEIADNCMIGANAVVNKSFTEPYSIIVGVPAKIVRKINIEITPK
jgi:serine O-acetyltransferase